MAHQIFQDRRMFYSGETPWHGLGTKLPANATWESIAPMFPNVHERPVLMVGGEVLPDVKALVSSDDGRYLATVGSDYTVVQAETIARAIMGAASDAGAIFHTGGLLGERGNRGWLLGELPKAGFQVRGDDSPVRAYFLGYWGHDGRTSVNLRNVSTRVVCANTVAAAMGERGNFRVSVRHTTGANNAVIQAGAQFSALYDASRKLQAFADAAAARKVTRDEVSAILNRLFPVKATDGETTDRELEKVDAAKLNVLRLHESPTVAAALRGTAWGIAQAATEHAEHFSARITDAQRQINAIAERQLAAGLDAAALAYAAVSEVTGIPLPA